MVELGKVETATVYHVISNTDLTEGRGAQTTVGMFLDRTTAHRAAKGGYIMGTDCPVETKSQLVVRLQDGSVHILGGKVNAGTELPGDVRKRALDKLTDEEKKALGVR